MEPIVAARATSFEDFDAFAAAIAGAGGLVIPMAAGPWRATLETLALGGMVLHRARVPPQIRTGTIAPGELVLVSRAPEGSVLHAGQVVEPGTVALHGDGAPIEARFLRPATWMGIQLPPGSLARLAEDRPGAVPDPGAHRLSRDRPLEKQGLMALVQAGLAAATAGSGLLAHPAAVAGLRESVETELARLLTGPAEWARQTRATAARLRVVRAVEDVLQAAPSRAPTITGLCAAVGVAPRTLHAAFAAVHGCSPHAFLKRWRLVMVRRALRAEGPAPLVKTAALDHGFWHLGHFARDYRAMFGEHPRETGCTPGTAAG